MKPSQLFSELERISNAGLTAMIWGPVGCGKSSIVRQFVESQGKQLIDLRASQLDPVDARGIPGIDPETNLTRWYPPNFLPQDDNTDLFLDEINKANQDTLASLYQLILDGRSGDYELPKGSRIYCAGNREFDQSFVTPMPRALKARLVHVTLEPDVDEFIEHAIRNNFDERVVSFVRYRPELLDEVEAATRDNNGEKMNVLKNTNAYANARSWEFVSKLINNTPDLSAAYFSLEGAVGEGSATEFIAYSKIYNELMDLDELLESPKQHAHKLRQITSPSALYAICTGLIYRANKNNFSNLVELSEIVPSEYGTWLVKDTVAQHQDTITDHPAYLKWVAKSLTEDM